MLVPVPILVPPQLPEYHSHEAPVPRLPPLKVKVTLVPGQTLLLLKFREEGAVEIDFTVKCVRSTCSIIAVPFCSYIVGRCS